MNNNEAANQELRKYVQANLTPTVEERRLISSIYEAICSILGDGKCIQIGSYPRYTAIRPPHDLDILFILGRWDHTEPKPFDALLRLKQRLAAKLTPPQGFSFTVELQTHSITIKFTRKDEEVFAVDIVPSLITGANNEFGQDIYLVPEILGFGHTKRQLKYKRVKENKGHIDWILSDPRGYVSMASALNLLNKDFRKAVKFLKKWKFESKKRNNAFKLKSFHIEQIATSYFQKNHALTILDALTKFFVELPSWLTGSQIPDRADSSKKIDDYIDELTLEQRSIILKSRDEFLERLQCYEGEQEAEILFKEKSFAARAGLASGAAMTSIEPRRVIPRSTFGD